jgi:DNA polymerase elongation subunit (family B)
MKNNQAEEMVDLAQPEFKLSRVCSSFNRGQWKIHLFGYDGDNRPQKKIAIFDDYFYYSKKHIADVSGIRGFTVEDGKSYKSLYDDEVVKVTYRSIKTKNEFVKSHPERIHEADVLPEQKYILDNKIEWSEYRNIMYFDIETWYDDEDPKGNMPDAARMPITAIVGYSTFDQEYFVFSWNPEKTKDFIEPKLVTKDNINYSFFANEEDMLFSFIEFVKLSHVDVLTGWYSGQYDLPYIINRSKALGMDSRKISPITELKMYKKGDYFRIYMKGLDHVDMQDALQDLGYNLPNWKLATAAEVILKDPDVEKLKVATWKNWLDDYTGFLEYAVRDVEILVEIEKKLKIFELYNTLQATAGLVNMSLVMMKSVVVDSFILSSFHNKIIFPTRVTAPRQNYTGAVVLDPMEPGVHRDMCILDYTSLYPTTIMTFNISPETYIVSADDCKKVGMKIEDVMKSLTDDGIGYIDTGYHEDLFGGRYLFYDHKHKLGLMPFLLKKLFLTRVEANEKLKLSTTPEEERLSLNVKQRALKLILNSAYGAMGFNYFRLYKPECADAITFFAREALKYAVVKFHTELKHPVIYGDTDSIFVKQNGYTISQIMDKLDDFRGMLRNDFAKKYIQRVDDDYFYMDLKFEMDLDYMYFSNAKKRYYAIERNSQKSYIKGLNIIRKDAPKYAKLKLDDLAEKAVRQTLTVDELVDLRKEIEITPYTELGITKSFTKKFFAYTKNKPQHLTAALWVNDILNAGIDHMDKPLLFYVISNCQNDLKPRERNTAICLNEEQLNLIDENPDKFKLDYDTFFQKQILDQIEEFDQIPSVKKVVEEYKEIING